MIARRYLESLRTSIRDVKWCATRPPHDLNSVAKQAAWCADYISELLERIDDDVILRTNVSRECVIEIRANQRPTKAREIDLLIEILQLTKKSLEREKSQVEHDKASNLAEDAQ